MRVYGTSPLYNYVELVFRCKRLFILAIILGTIITSTMVYLRKTTYSGTFVAALAGDVEAVSTRRADLEDSPAARKANRLVFWVRKDPEFMPGVIRNANLDRKYPNEDPDKLLKRVRDSITSPTIINNVYMEVGMTWQKASELEDVLNQLYSAFSRKTVDTETANVTLRRQRLEEQYRTYNRKADESAMKRVRYLSEHYWQQTALLGSSMSLLDRAENQIAETRMELGDSKQRLALVERSLAMTPRTLSESETAENVTDPTLQLATRVTDLEADREKLLQRFTPSHPSVVAIDREIEGLKNQIEASKNKVVRSGSTTKTRTMRNPQYDEFLRWRTQFAVAVKGLESRARDLESQIGVQTSRVKEMPIREVEYDKINREFNLANSIRNQTEAQLAAAKIDEEHDRFIQSKTVNMVVPPKAESLQSGGKTALLYVLGPILGVIVAFGFSLLLESLDHTLRTPVEVEKYLGKPVLAVIPKMQSPRESRKKLAGASKQSITS